jgi:acyl carrier protein
MNNSIKYKQSFAEALNVKIDVIKESLKYNEIDEWDSIGHMTLISKLEEEFNISMETDDIVNFDSFKTGIDILKKNYDIKFD